MKKRVHYTDEYLIYPQHPISINLIGGGGTGSQVLTCLARLDVTLRALGHPGLFVQLYDPDTVSETNIGRQLFSESEIGLNKAQCLISRVNNFFGNEWVAISQLYPQTIAEMKREHLANVYITCTDNLQSRLTLWSILQQIQKMGLYDMQKPRYWMDFGNGQAFGQVLIGTISPVKQPESKMYETVASLKVITEYVVYSKVKEEDSGPSCSLAEALDKQDLFINSTLAQFGCNILWKMFNNGMIEHNGLFLNLETLRVNPINV